MSLEFLERKKKAIDDALQAYQDFKKAIQELPSDWAKEILEDLTNEDGSLGAFTARELPVGSPTEQDHRPQFSSPSEAILAFLRKKHPEGVEAREIIRGVKGNFSTASTREAKLLYSILANMRRTGKIVQSADRRYHLPSHSSID